MVDRNNAFEIGFDEKIPTEAAIMNGWITKEPKVSIVCITFNQKEYLPRAIQSFLLQQTDFPFELVIHDDASTDGTELIIKNYAKLYPTIIKPIFETRNQYSQGVKIMTTICIPQCASSLIAICEGDDYWVSRKKLQRQYEAMARNPSIRLCFHQVRDVDSDEKLLGLASCYGEAEHLYSAKAIIDDILIRTSSIMVKKEIFQDLEKFNVLCPEAPVSDYPIKVIAADKKGAVYVPSILSAYRRNVAGSWTQKRVDDYRFYLDTNLKMFAMFEKLDRFLEGRYAGILKQKMKAVLVTLLRSEKVPVKDKIAIYVSYAHHLSLKERFLFHLVYRHRYLSQGSRKTVLFLRKFLKREQSVGNV
jgi:glycosyltransferase involved in cell wall biosynthesis